MAEPAAGLGLRSDLHRRAAGHDCMPIPASVKRGEGVCSICVGHDPGVAEAAFRAKVAELVG
jgi:hypothetical protein